MTIEHRMLLGLKDIKSIHIECKVCHARIVRSPDKSLTLPQGCSACGATWPQEFGDTAPIVKLVNLIVALRTSEPETYKLAFEIEYDTLRA